MTRLRAERRRAKVTVQAWVEWRTAPDSVDRERSGTETSFESSTLAGLADALIKARIARGWTQADLAEALGVAEQQIQRYESSRYAGASLARLGDIAAALNVEVRETVVLRAS